MDGGRQAGDRVEVYGLDAYLNEAGLAILDGSHSFSTRGPLSQLHWVQTDGPIVELSNADGALATFTAPRVAYGTLLSFRFSATDGTETVSDDVQVLVANLRTTAVAGDDREVIEGGK